MGTIHVLIADDSRDFRHSLRGLLDKEEGTEATREIRSRWPEVQLVSLTCLELPGTARMGTGARQRSILGLYHSHRR